MLLPESDGLPGQIQPCFFNFAFHSLVGSVLDADMKINNLLIVKYFMRSISMSEALPPGDCMTCMATSGNGPVQSIARITMGASSAVRNLGRAARVCCGAARGATYRGGCAGLCASPGARSPGAAPWVFAWPGLFPLLFDLFHFSFFFGGVAPILV